MQREREREREREFNEAVQTKYWSGFRMAMIT